MRNLEGSDVSNLVSDSRRNFSYAAEASTAAALDLSSIVNARAPSVSSRFFDPRNYTVASVIFSCNFKKIP